MLNTCKLCLQNKELCRSHIVPEFIYRPLYTSKHRMIKITDSAELLQKGLREELLCENCEKYLNDNFERPSVEIWEALTSQTASKNIKIRELKVNQGNHVMYFCGFDYQSFKLFLLSILWRVSISKGPGSRCLGPHEESIRHRLINCNPGKQSDYPCIINILTASSFTPITITNNHPRHEGHRIFRLILTNVLVWYIVSSHGVQASLTGLAVKEDGSFVATLLDPKEVKMLKEISSEVKNIGIPDYMLK